MNERLLELSVQLCTVHGSDRFDRRIEGLGDRDEVYRFWLRRQLREIPELADFGTPAGNRQGSRSQQERVGWGMFSGTRFANK